MVEARIEKEAGFQSGPQQIDLCWRGSADVIGEVRQDSSGPMVANCYDELTDPLAALLEDITAPCTVTPLTVRK